jgi:hypothetical protein
MCKVEKMVFGGNSVETERLGPCKAEVAAEKGD